MNFFKKPRDLNEKLRNFVKFSFPKKLDIKMLIVFFDR